MRIKKETKEESNNFYFAWARFISYKNKELYLNFFDNFTINFTCNLFNL